MHVLRSTRTMHRTLKMTEIKTNEKLELMDKRELVSYILTLHKHVDELMDAIEDLQLSYHCDW